MLKSDGTAKEFLYLHRDYQGTILAITNQTAQVLEKRLFDAWGNIVKVTDGAGNVLNGLTLIDRGYTGHEHLQSVGLIHMNGRLYDPKLHRFLQPDNFVQNPYNTQNYNRYGYVLNNPLMYTDPSGESFKYWWAANWKTVVTIAAAVGTAVVIVASLGTATPLVAALWAGAGAGFVGGSLGTALNGGTVGQSLTAGLIGAAKGAVMAAAGAYIGAAIGAVGIIPGALSGSASTAGLGIIANILTGEDWDKGLGLNAAMGAIGGGISGGAAAKANGSGMWFGTPSKPAVSVISTKIDNSFNKGMKEYQSKAISTETKATTSSMNSSSEVAKLDKLIKQAQELYPNKAGKIELHHVEPKYLGGPKDGTLVPLDAAYHQVITNEFRTLYPYGQPIPNGLDLKIIMQQVYAKLPLPPSSGIK